MNPKVKPKTPIFRFEVEVTGELEVYVQAPSKAKARQVLKTYLDDSLQLDNALFPKTFTEVNEVIDGDIFGGDEVPDEK